MRKCRFIESITSPAEPVISVSHITKGILRMMGCQESSYYAIFLEAGDIILAVADL